MTVDRSWLRPVLEAIEAGPLTVVGRSAATVRGVKAALVAQAAGRPRGYVGLSFTTLVGAVLQEAPPEEESSDRLLPAGVAWEPLLRSRPRLQRQLRSLIERLRALEAVGESLAGVRPELLELVRSGWGGRQLADAAARFLANPPAGELAALGFGGPDFSFAGSFGRLELRLALALGSAAFERSTTGRPTPGERLRVGLPTFLVPDVAAEARLVTSLALREPGTLVLVPDRLAAQRLRAALCRNGVEVAADDDQSLSAHGLAALFGPLVPLAASGGETLLDHRVLLRLITHPLLSRRVKPVEEDEEEPEAEEPSLRISARHARELIVACRRLALPVAQWQERLAAQVVAVERQAAEATEERAKSLQRRVETGRAILALLVQLRAAIRSGTLGALGRLGLQLGLTGVGGDPLGRAFLAALVAAGPRRATEESFEELLTGAVSAGHLGEGVRLLRYEQYDGRDAARVVLTGVHGKGLARPPGAEPFLLEGDRRVLGLPESNAAIEERLALARWAVGRAGEAFAIASQTDETGRATVLPASFAEELELRSEASRASYGLRLAAQPPREGRAPPELTDLGAFQSGGIGSAGAAALQIDVEWARAGVRLEGSIAGSGASQPEKHSLAELLERDRELVPLALRPWLGWLAASPAEAPGLPQKFRLTASRLANFTKCPAKAMYQEWVGLSPRDEPEEEFDSREQGTVVHRILEETTPGIFWLVPEAELEARRAAFVGKLRGATARAFAESEAGLGLSEAPASKLGRAALARRVGRRLELFAAERISSVEECVETIKERARPKGNNLGLLDCDDGDALLRRFGSPEWESKLLGKRGRGFVDWLEQHASAGTDLFADPELFLKEFGTKKAKKAENIAARKMAEEALAQPETRKLVERLLVRYREQVLSRLPAPGGDQETIDVELVFGEGDLAPATMRIGRAEVPVSGRIDTVFHLRGTQPGGGVLELLDYKSRGTPRAQKVDPMLIEPQLVFYALAVSKTVQDGAAGLPALPVGGLLYDSVLSGTRSSVSIAAPPRLARAEAAFGRLLDDARDGVLPLLPHPYACPHEERNAYCDLAAVCRHRRSWQPLPPADDAASEEESE